MAQGHNYSYNKIELKNNFQKNLKSSENNFGWGFDGCARWRKVTITVTIKIELWNNFQTNLKSLGIKLGWGLDGSARWRKVTITVTVK